MEKDYIISAQNARTKADTSQKFLKRVMKEINNLSEDGYTKLRWSIVDASEKLIERIKEQLTQLGYKVQIEKYTDQLDGSKSDEYPGCLVISW